MRFKKSYVKWVLLVLAAFVFFPIKVIYSVNIENWAEKNGLDKVYSTGVGFIMESTLGATLVVLFCTLIGGFIALFLDELWRKKYTVTFPKVSKVKTIIEDEVFINCEIPLDGFGYRNCKMENVTFLYNGGKLELTGNNISGKIMIQSEIDEINGMIFLMSKLGFTEAPIIGEKGKILSKFDWQPNDPT